MGGQARLDRADTAARNTLTQTKPWAAK
jgi:hypothetical protein